LSDLLWNCRKLCNIVVLLVSSSRSGDPQPKVVRPAQIWEANVGAKLIYSNEGQEATKLLIGLLTGKDLILIHSYRKLLWILGKK